MPQSPKIINISGNSLKDNEVKNMLINIKGNIELLDLSNNKLSNKSVDLMLPDIKDNILKISHLNLENNKFSISSIISLCENLSANK